MKNIKKTVAAGVVGIALLAGLGGTFALWVAEGTEPIGQINTGRIEVRVDDANSWTLNNSDDSEDQLRDHTLIPGDTVVGDFTKTATVQGGRVIPVEFDGFSFDGTEDVDFRKEGDVYRIWIHNDAVTALNDDIESSDGWTRSGFTVSIGGFHDGTAAVVLGQAYEFTLSINFDNIGSSADMGLNGLDLGDLVVYLKQLPVTNGSTVSDTNGS